jgi:hypothetical protein
VPSLAITPNPPGDPDIVNTVTAYLEADAVHDYETMMMLSDGSIHIFWQWWQWELGSCNCPAHSLAIKHLKVVRESSKSASIDLVAEMSPTGTTISGPMTLLRHGSKWVVHDYRRNGVDFAASIAARTGHQQNGGVDVRLLGLDRDPTSEDVWFRITNSRPDAISLASYIASSGSMKLSSSQYNPAVKNIFPNRWMVTNLVWHTPHRLRAGQPLRVRLVFFDLTTNERISVSFTTAA